MPEPNPFQRQTFDAQAILFNEGEMALFDDQPHMASAIALTPVVTLMLSRDEFRKRVEAMDPLMRGIVVLMVKRLRQTVLDLKATTGEVNWANWRRKKSQGARR